MLALHPKDWIRVAGEDLFEFVCSGGALVRFVVSRRPQDLDFVHRELEDKAQASNMFFFSIDSTETKIHQPNELLRAIASQLDLGAIMTSFVIEAIVREGYEVPTGAERVVLADVARINDLVTLDVVKLLRRQFRSQILQDERLVRDVRYALQAMAEDVLRGSDVESGIALTDRWLRGQVSRIKELREFGIIQKVNRYNARSLLRSLLTWLPASGRRGSVIYIDAWRLGRPQGPRDGYLYYSRVALIDAYEVMREFIDDTDELYNVLFVFAMPPEFLSIEPRGRGMGAYQALEFRVSGFAEARLANPLANLVEVSTDAERRTFGSA
jgi:hypothetical protein